MVKQRQKNKNKIRIVIIIIIILIIMKKILFTTMLTIKILFTINSLEKKEIAIHSKHYSQFLSI